MRASRHVNSHLDNVLTNTCTQHTHIHTHTHTHTHARTHARTHTHAFAELRCSRWRAQAGRAHAHCVHCVATVRAAEERVRERVRAAYYYKLETNMNEAFT